MSRQCNGTFARAITDEQLAIFREVYPKGGARAVAKRIDGMSLSAITQTARRYDIRRTFDGKQHGGSRGGGRPKKGSSEGRYVPGAAEQRRLIEALRLFEPLREFRVIASKGQLVPTIDTRLAA